MPEQWIPFVGIVVGSAVTLWYYFARGNHRNPVDGLLVFLGGMGCVGGANSLIFACIGPDSCLMGMMRPYIFLGGVALLWVSSDGVRLRIYPPPASPG